MRRVGGKREIEAVCESWVGGVCGYLTWKLKRVLGVDGTGEDGGMEDFISLERIEGTMEMEESIFGLAVERESFELHELEDDILLLVDNDDDKENYYLEEMENNILDLDDMDLADFNIDVDGIIDI